MNNLTTTELLDRVEQEAGGTLAAEVNRRLNQPQPISDEMRELEEAYQRLLSAYNKLKEATK